MSKFLKYRIETGNFYLYCIILKYRQQGGRIWGTRISLWTMPPAWSSLFGAPPGRQWTFGAALAETEYAFWTFLLKIMRVSPKGLQIKKSLPLFRRRLLPQGGFSCWYPWHSSMLGLKGQYLELAALFHGYRSVQSSRLWSGGMCSIWACFAYIHDLGGPTQFHQLRETVCRNVCGMSSRNSVAPH